MSLTPSSQLLLLTARWVLPIAKPPIDHGAVLVDGGNVLAVGPVDRLVAEHPDVARRDFGQSAILPGFVNAHTHLDLSVLRGVGDDLPFVDWLIELRDKVGLLEEGDLSVSAATGALEALRSGITCVGDVSRGAAGLIAAREAGLRGTAYLEVMGMDGREVGRTVEATARSLKECEGQTGPLLSLGVAPDAPYTVGPLLYREICAFARAEGYPLVTHLGESPAEYQFVKYGASALAHEFQEAMGWGEILWQPMGCSPVKYLEQWGVYDGKLTAVHCVQVDGRDLDILERYEVGVVHCPRSNAKLGAGIAPLAEFIQRGLRVGLGTGSLAGSVSMDLFDEMRIGILLHRSRARQVDNVGAEHFVRMATLGGAEVLGLDDRIGSLEPGKAADLIAVDLSRSHQTPVREPYAALVYTATEGDVLLTMVEGRTLYERGEWKTLDSEAIKSRANQVREKMGS